MPNLFQRPWTVTLFALLNTFLWGSAFPFMNMVSNSFLLENGFCLRVSYFY